MRSDPFSLLLEVAQIFKPGTWILVGGLMVHCHAQMAGITHLRPTDDADIVVKLHTGSYATHAQALITVGFVPHEPINVDAPFHRFVRGIEIVDLMVSDRQSRRSRYMGRDIVRVPGSGSALKRAIEYELNNDVRIHIPDLPSAISLKGAAHQVPSVNRVRHLQDAVTLLACGGPTGLEPEPSKSMRSNLNHVVQCLMDSAEAWSLTAPANRIRAIQCLEAFSQVWQTPPFLESTVVTPSSRRPKHRR